MVDTAPTLVESVPDNTKWQVGDPYPENFGIALRCRWPWLCWAPDPRSWLWVSAMGDIDSLQLFRVVSYI
jgi:hypothetical protein